MVGCSSESEDDGTENPVDLNTPPKIELNNNPTNVLEGETVEIKFNVFDEQDNYSQLKISVGTDIVGSTSIDRSKKTVLYTAPWIKSEETIVDTLIITVTDTGGQSAQASVDLTVDDKTGDEYINTLAMTPSNSAFNYIVEADKKNASLFVYEGEELELRYTLTEPDADDSELDFNSTGIIVTRDLEIKATDSYDAVITLNTPQLNNVPSGTAKVALVASDNDGDFTYTTEITVIKHVSMKWDESPSLISESDGGTISYQMSEGFDYPAEYELEIYHDGKQLDESYFHASLDSKTGRVNFPSAGKNKVQEDMPLEVVVKLWNKIENSYGEIHNEMTEITKNITIKNDRDDDFNDLFSEYEEKKNKFLNLASRQDDVQVAKSLATTWVYIGVFSTADLTDFAALAKTTFTSEVSILNDQILAIRNENDYAKKESLISYFLASLASFGKETRKLMADKDGELRALYPEVQFIALPPPELLTYVTVFENDTGFLEQISFYIDQPLLGERRIEESQGSWVFSGGFKYMRVANLVESGNCLMNI
jgi:hypothetical protein